MFRLLFKRKPSRLEKIIMASHKEIVDRLLSADAKIDQVTEKAKALSSQLDVVIAKIAELKANGGASAQELEELAGIAAALDESAEAAGAAVTEAESKAEEAAAEPAPEQPAEPAAEEPKE
jgi:uncharacterized protein YaaN involved in tellurite resistance